MVVAIAALAVLVLSVRGVATKAVLLGFAFVSLLVIVLGLGMAAHRLPGASRATATVERWPRVLELARRLREGLAVAGRPRTIAAALFFSALAWAASIGTFLAAGQAVGIQLSLAQAALLTSGVALVTIIPAGPGFVGTFELTVVEIAAGFGVPRDAAFALGLLIHVMILGTTSVGGVIALLARRSREAREPADPAGSAGAAPVGGVGGGDRAARAAAAGLIVAATFPHVFEPLQLRHKTLASRIVFGAHTANMAENGLPGERHIGYYRERALGGAAMIVVEPVPIHRTGVLTRGNFRHDDDAIIPAFRAVTDACREANPGS